VGEQLRCAAGLRILAQDAVGFGEREAWPIRDDERAVEAVGFVVVGGDAAVLAGRWLEFQFISGGEVWLFGFRGALFIRQIAVSDGWIRRVWLFN
jgi:hypothetical protein